MGKSFAYLVPAILAAVEPKKKVVVSTHTIALQEQLSRKDIPFLRRSCRRSSRPSWSKGDRTTSACGG